MHQVWWYRSSFSCAPPWHLLKSLLQNQTILPSVLYHQLLPHLHYSLPFWSKALFNWSYSSSISYSEISLLGILKAQMDSMVDINISSTCSWTHGRATSRNSWMYTSHCLVIDPKQMRFSAWSILLVLSKISMLKCTTSPSMMSISLSLIKEFSVYSSQSTVPTTEMAVFKMWVATWIFLHFSVQKDYIGM